MYGNQGYGQPQYQQVPPQQYQQPYPQPMQPQYQQMPPQQYQQPYPQQMPPPQYQQMPPQQYQQFPQQFAPAPAQVVVVVQQQAAPKRKGWARLERDSIHIKQDFQLMAALTGCVPPTTFKLSALGKDGEEKGAPLFYGKEESECCARQCMGADCRPFVLKLKLSDPDETLDKENFLQLNRECKCTLLCCNRPVVTVDYIEDGQNVYIGKVVNPWTMCNVQLDVYDKDNVHKYIVDASCCQLGFHCHWPCESCQTIDFDIKTPSGEVVSSMQKRVPGCVAATFTNMDNFLLHFPKGATKEDKALLIAATLFADYRFFERRQKKLAQ